MAPGFQSSFIPKNAETQEILKKKPTSILGVLIIAIFVMTIIAAVGMFFYKKMIKGDIVAQEADLTVALQSIDQKSIDQMVNYSQKLSIVKSIVFKHQVVSGFLNSLSSSTVSTVSFNDFIYNNLTGNSLTVTMRGKANNYSTVALQESIFAKNKYWRSVVFSNLSLSEKGGVSFEVKVEVDPEIAIYAPKIEDIPVEVEGADVNLDKELEGIDELSAEINNL